MLGNDHAGIDFRPQLCVGGVGHLPGSLACGDEDQLAGVTGQLLQGFFHGGIRQGRMERSLHDDVGILEKGHGKTSDHKFISASTAVMPRRAVRIQSDETQLAAAGSPPHFSVNAGDRAEGGAKTTMARACRMGRGSGSIK